MHKPAEISTHTPLARRDFIVSAPLNLFFTFLLTRLLRGVTQPARSRRSYRSSFLLTRLLRGVTVAANILQHPKTISTHTPLARRDFCRARFSSCGS